jgi:hypothetical protein
MYILTQKTVTLRGQDVPPGEVIEVPDRSGAALIAEGAGIEVTPDGKMAAALGGQEQKPDDEAAAKAAEIAQIREALYSQYKRDELAEAAKQAGVDFAYDAKKAEIIQAIIDQGKVAAILK